MFSEKKRSVLRFSSARIIYIKIIIKALDILGGWVPIFELTTGRLRYQDDIDTSPIV